MVTPSNHIQVPPLPKPPGHDSINKQGARPVRRVSFSEIPPKPYRPQRQRKRGCCSCCCICCMWTCILLLCFVFVFALVGALFFGYFQPQLPAFHIERLTFPEFKVTATSQQNYLSTELDLYVVVTNINRKIEFSFSPLMVYVSSLEYVNLGKAEVPGFSLGLHNTTVLKVHSGVADSLVDNAKGERLRTQFEGKTEMNVDVFFSGTLRVSFGRLAALNFPITVICKDVNVYKVGLGIEPECKVELFTFGVVSETNLF